MSAAKALDLRVAIEKANAIPYLLHQCKTSEEQRERAALTVCALAGDAAQATPVLEALGLIDPPDPQQVKQARAAEAEADEVDEMHQWMLQNGYLRPAGAECQFPHGLTSSGDHTK